MSPVGIYNKNDKFEFVLPEAHASVRYKRVELWAGRRREVMGLGDTTLSSGFYSVSGNSLPVPKVQIGTVGFTPLKFTRNFVAVHAGFAHGWFNTDYIQGVRLNGRPYDRTWLRHADLVAGAHLEFAMGPTPSRWGTGEAAMLPSLTVGQGRPAPWRDQADLGRTTVTAGTADAAALHDNTSDTEATLADPAAGVTLATSDGPRRVLAYTLTSSAHAGADPADWRLQGSNDGTRWTDLDTRRGERFDWRRQTRAFLVAHPGSYRYYRWTPGGHGPVALAEIEWLGPVPDNGRLPR